MNTYVHDLLLDHLPRLRAYARTLTRSTADADDLTQTAALKILRFESRYERDTNFAAWSRAILRNSMISDCRKPSYRRTDSLDAMTDASTLHLSLVTPARQEEHVLEAEILRATASLQPRLRQALMLVGEDDLSYEQVATVMSCSVGTVKSRLWRARARMKTLLESPARTAA
jgi:RNA polymerase sigma-70 factor (ECF subfamily)